MKYLSYTWLAFKGLVTLMIVWLLYSKANTDFEIITVSILLVIHTHLTSLASGLTSQAMLMELRSTKRFVHILQILKRNDKIHKESEALKKAFRNEGDEDEKYENYSEAYLDAQYGDDQDTKEDLIESENVVKKQTVQMYIIQTFDALVYAVAVYNIVWVLL